MTAKEFFESQLVSDANSVIKKYAKYYNRFDLIRFAEAYHRNELQKLGYEIVKVNKSIKREITCECGKTITVMTNNYGQSNTGKATCECGAVVYIN